jgi:pyruvate dehydrogenase E2 component (dihydrolipoamide acetyltransferase)
MLAPVIIPKATISMEEGSILKWIKSEGDVVAKDDILFEMETDKAIVEVEAPADGVLLKIITAEGPVKVESVVGWIGQPGDVIREPPSVQPTMAVAENVAIPIARNEPEARLGRIVATPAARRRAAELGVDLKSVPSSASGGRISQEDVERFSTRTAIIGEPAAHLADRKILIERLTTTWQSVPHIHVARLLDASGLAGAKKKLAGTGISVTDLLLHVLAAVLPRFPELSMVWGGGKLIPATQINLAFAVDTNRGVVAPVISSANALGLADLSKKRLKLSKGAQARRLRPEDLQGGVFTLTNLGMQKVDFFAPLINSPQTAILAAGKMDQVPVVTEGTLAVGWRMWVNLAVDHRVSDGMAAARFLEQLQIEVGRLPENLGLHS